MESDEESLNWALLVVLAALGCLMIETSGGVVSTVHEYVPVPVLPDRSVADTEKLCAPASSPVRLIDGVGQATGTASS